MSQNIAVLGSSISLLSSVVSLKNCQISLFELEKSGLENIFESDLQNSFEKDIEAKKLEKTEDFENQTYNLLCNQAKKLPNIIFVEQKITSIEIEKIMQNDQKKLEQNLKLNLDNSEQIFETPFETLKTDNLVIKNLNSGHSKFAWLNYTQKVSQYLAESWSNFEDLEIDLDKKLKQNESKKRIDLAILDRENGDFIGVCGIWIDNFEQSLTNNFDAESMQNTKIETQVKNLVMEFWLKESVWNQGYGQEMALVVYKWLTKNIEFTKITLKIEKNNTFAQKIATNIGGIINKSKSEISFVKNEKLLNFVEYVVENKTKIENKNIANLTNLSQEMRAKINSNNNQNLANNSENMRKTANKLRKNLFCIRVENSNQKLYFDKIITSFEIWQSLEARFSKNLQELSPKLVKNTTNNLENQKPNSEENCPHSLTTSKIEFMDKMAKNGIFLMKNLENEENKNLSEKTLEQIQIGLETAQKFEL